MYNFDEPVNKRGTLSGKWREIKDGGYIPDGAIPMHVAEMDYKIAPELADRITKRVEWMNFGYDHLPDGFEDAIVWHYQDKFGVKLEKEWIVKIPSIMSGMNMACKMIGGTLFYNSPMYSHIRVLTDETKQPVIEVPMGLDGNRYFMDLNKMEEMITPDVKSFILCNPHNPVGRVYSKEELEEVVAFCKKHDLILISDEIHCEIVYDGQHLPCFGINEDSLNQSMTFNSAGKILNIPGLPSAIVIIPNKKLREQFIEYTEGMFAYPNAIAWEALKANYDGCCDNWKNEVRSYLKENRDYLEERISKMPLIKATHNEGTYLTWVDCTALNMNPKKFFLEKANVFFNGGKEFGDEHFVRINFACTRKQLKEVLDKMEQALIQLSETLK